MKLSDYNVDYVAMHFNGADRTKDRETTDATAIHPISKRCEKIIKQYAAENNIEDVNGVILIAGVGDEEERIIDILEGEGFIEATFFIDSIYQETTIDRIEKKAIIDDGESKIAEKR